MLNVSEIEDEVKNDIKEYGKELLDVYNIDYYRDGDIMLITDKDIEKLKNGFILSFYDGEYYHNVIYKKE